MKNMEIHLRTSFTTQTESGKLNYIKFPQFFCLIYELELSALGCEPHPSRFNTAEVPPPGLIPLLQMKKNHESQRDLAFSGHPEGDEESSIESIRAYRSDSLKFYSLFLYAIPTCFVPLLLLKWFLKVRLKLLYSPCSLHKATHLYINGTGKGIHAIALIQRANIQHTIQNNQDVLMKFTFRHFDYFWEIEKQMWEPIRFLDANLTFNRIYADWANGIQDEIQIQNTRSRYGECIIDLPVKSAFGIFVDEILSPFYLFQIYSFILWNFYSYYYYAAVIMVMTIVSGTVELLETRGNMIRLHDMVMHECPVQVLRKEKIETIPSKNLVSGDIFLITNEMKLPCDSILLSGSCIVNESMLTGESLPVQKSPPPHTDHIYTPKTCEKHTLFSGTKVIQTKQGADSEVFGMVTNTGFATTKGALIRYILYPRPSNFNFTKDSYKFISVLALFSLVGYLAVLPSCIKMGLSTKEIVLRGLDLITCTVPPALPMAMSIGIAIALKRLKKKSIYCISPLRINVSGKIRTMVFDKTGTLTEDSLNLLGFTAIHPDTSVPRFTAFHHKCVNFQPYSMCSNYAEYLRFKNTPTSRFLEAIGSCHSLTIVDGKFIGDPLEIELFMRSAWKLVEPESGSRLLRGMIAAVMPKLGDTDLGWLTKNDTKYMIHENRPYQLAIIKRFDFTPKLQRMSVIVQNMRDMNYSVNIKGAPEIIKELCDPHSIPQNYNELLSTYTNQGFRVLGVATRNLGMISSLTDEMFPRREIEKDLIFLGFVVFENKLKAASRQNIETLKSAKIRSIMATGDNILTAIAVAKECGIIPKRNRVLVGELESEEVGKPELKWKELGDQSPAVSEGEDDINAITILIQNSMGSSPSSPQPSVFSVKTTDTLTLRNINQPSDEMENRSSEEEGDNSPTHSDHNQETNNLTNINLDHMNHFNSSSKSSFCGMGDPNCEFGPQLEDTDLSEGQFPWEKYHMNYSLALPGRAFEYIKEKYSYDPVIMKELNKHGAVYARMTPENKAQLVESLQNEKYLVGMCGDGTNDCAALKRADIGISLSEAEASIAAPFTSKINDISCVNTLLKQGRCAIVTSFQCFQYMALYSMIQFTTIIILYLEGANLSDMAYLYIDLFIIIPLCLTMSWTRPADCLSSRQPTGSLISLRILSSVIGQTLIQASAQIGMYYFLLGQPFYVPMKVKKNGNPDDYVKCQESTVLFLFSSIQYIVIVLVYSIGKPFRKAIYSNKYYTINLLLSLGITYYLMIFPSDFIINFFKMDKTIAKEEWRFRMYIIVGTVIYAIVAFFYEKVIVGGLVKLQSIKNSSASNTNYNALPEEPMSLMANE